MAQASFLWGMHLYLLTTDLAVGSTLTYQNALAAGMAAFDILLLMY